MDLHEALYDSDWREINTKKRLLGCLSICARDLRKKAQEGAGDVYGRLADKWESRIRAGRRQKGRLNKEQINVILFSACFELERAGLPVKELLPKNHGRA